MAATSRLLALRAFDARAGELVDDALALGMDAQGAWREVDALAALAGRIVLAIEDWGLACRGLGLGLCAPLRAAGAAPLIVEAVFDPLLEPASTRVLAAALDLAC